MNTRLPCLPYQACNALVCTVQAKRKAQRCFKVQWLLEFPWLRHEPATAAHGDQEATPETAYCAFCRAHQGDHRKGLAVGTTDMKKDTFRGHHVPAMHAAAQKAQIAHRVIPV